MHNPAHEGAARLCAPWWPRERTQEHTAVALPCMQGASELQLRVGALHLAAYGVSSPPARKRFAGRFIRETLSAGETTVGRSTALPRRQARRWVSPWLPKPRAHTATPMPKRKNTEVIPKCAPDSNTTGCMRLFVASLRGHGADGLAVLHKEGRSRRICGGAVCQSLSWLRGRWG